MNITKKEHTVVMTHAEVERFQKKTTNELQYRLINSAHLQVYNGLNEKIAEIGFDLIAEQIYCDSWFGFVTSEELKEVMEGPYLAFFAKSGCNKKICNTLGLLGGMDQDTLQWFETVMVPKLVAAGMQYNAFLIPTDVFAQHTVEQLEKNVGDNLCKLFDSEATALAWLRSV